MGALIGKIRKEYILEGKAEAIKKGIYQIASEMDELEKGLSYFNGFKILSKKRVNIHLLNQRAYTCFFSLTEEENHTKVEVTISTYAYVELSLIALSIFLLFFSGLLILNEDSSLRRNGEGYTEYGLLFFMLPILYQFYKNWNHKKNGSEAIERLMNQLDKHFKKE